MQTNSQTEQQTYGGQSFEPFAFDPHEREPEAAEGDYSFDIKNAKGRRKAPEKGGYHQLSLTLKITNTSSETDEAEKSVGGTIYTDITFFPRGERAKASNVNKRNYLNLLAQCGIESDVMTTVDEKNISDLAEMLKGREGIRGSVRLSTVGEPGQERTFVNVNFANADEMPETEEEPETPPARPARAAAAPARRPAAKPAAKSTGGKATAKRR